ncbi:MFS transporter [Variovorax sp. J22G21]|uniref:MFS transporter n=1 Tax=Variovorax fucosicus TaxID=3053517 RepID=UPI002576F5F2|nr:MULTISPECIES: MFS transporter [unclassified Variovorax]MDM0038592.1 MFS transporter [Variovorax sp. J22R193]MDM0063368.1 MFS transporter [Variovorax sp. J22G21]
MNTATFAAGATAPSLAETSDDALFRKITWRLLPLLFACYVLNYLDRTNIGYAQLQMKDQLSFSDTVFGLGAGIFFIGYAVFEIPSNLMLAKIGVRATLLRIMGLWGLTSAAMMFATTPTHFYVLRFLLGVFEAGFAPGILFYLTLWFPAGRRAKATALFFMGPAAAPLFAGPLAGIVMTSLDGAYGLAGWQWLFLVEGVPSVVLGVAVFFLLSNTPADAPWLNDIEKQRVRHLLEHDLAAHGSHERQTIASALRDGRVWLLGFISFLVILGVYAMAFWQPTMLKGMGLTVLQVGFYSMVPALAGIAAMIIIGGHSDRQGERRWHFAITACVGALGLSLTTLFMKSPVPAVACLALAAIGISSAFTILWTVPGILLSKKAAAAGIALISTIGGCAGLVAPLVVGAIKTATGGFTLSLYLLSGALVLAAVLMLVGLRLHSKPG